MSRRWWFICKELEVLRCLSCGRRIDVCNDYYLAVYEYNGNILFSVYVFCDYECLKEWVGKRE